MAGITVPMPKSIPEFVICVERKVFFSESPPQVDSPAHLGGSGCDMTCHHFLGYRFQCLCAETINLIFQFLCFINT